MIVGTVHSGLDDGGNDCERWSMLASWDRPDNTVASISRRFRVVVVEPLPLQGGGHLLWTVKPAAVRHVACRTTSQGIPHRHDGDGIGRGDRPRHGPLGHSPNLIRAHCDSGRDVVVRRTCASGQTMRKAVGDPSSRAGTPPGGVLGRVSTCVPPRAA